MVKPISLKTENGERYGQFPRPAVSLIRAAAAFVRAGGKGSPQAAYRELGYAHDPVADYIIRAATSAADTTSAAWAQPLAGIAIYDLLQTVTSQSAAAEVISRGLKITMDRIAEYRIPGRTPAAAAAGMWVAEETAAPARQLAFSNTAILRPKKLAVGYAYSREQAESSNIENIVRATLSETVGLALDLQLFSATAGDAAKPPGLLVGVAPIGAATGGGSNAMMTDLGKLFGALAAQGAGKNAVIVAAVPEAVTLKATLGPKWDYDIIPSTSLAAGTVVAVELGSVVSGFSAVPEFAVSQHAVYHAEDTAPTDITGGTPSPAVPVRSAFQTDTILLKMHLSAAWGLRASNHCQWIQGATW
jgi:hypothetical protein